MTCASVVDVNRCCPLVNVEVLMYTMQSLNGTPALIRTDPQHSTALCLHQQRNISAGQIFEISDRITQLVTIQFDPKLIQLFEIFKHLLKHNT